MCGRYVLRATTDTIATRFEVAQPALDLQPRYNIAPTQLAPVIWQSDTRQLALMRWGLVPAWAKTDKLDVATFNARAEGIDQKAMFRGPVRRRRCLVPADGFYEWEKVGKQKQPHYIGLRAEELFSFAGLYDIYRASDGTELWSFTIITTVPNDLIAPLHNRMAVILQPQDEEEWLDPHVTDPQQIMRLLTPYPDTAMTSYSVSTRVNDTHHEGPELIRPQPNYPPITPTTLF